MTAVSAVIFLVTAEYNMATTYIVGRVEAGEFGLAIAYSTVLILVMLLAIVADPVRRRRAAARRTLPREALPPCARASVHEPDDLRRANPPRHSRSRPLPSSSAA